MIGYGRPLSDSARAKATVKKVKATIHSQAFGNAYPTSYRN